MLCLRFRYFIILFTHTHSWSSPRLTQLRVWGGGLFLDPRDSALGFMSLRAPGRDPPRPLIPEARPEAGGLLRVQGQPVLAGREPGLPGRLRRHGDREGHRAAPARGSWRRPAAWGEGSLRHSLAVIPQAHIFTHNYPPASENHSQSSPCLRKSLTIIPLP